MVAKKLEYGDAEFTEVNADTVTVNNFADINSFEVGVATVTKELYADKIYLGTSPATATQIDFSGRLSASQLIAKDSGGIPIYTLVTSGASASTEQIAKFNQTGFVIGGDYDPEALLDVRGDVIVSSRIYTHSGNFSLRNDEERSGSDQLKLEFVNDKTGGASSMTVLNDGSDDDFKISMGKPDGTGYRQS